MPTNSRPLGHAVAGLIILAAVLVLALDLFGDPLLVEMGARDPGPGFQPRIVLLLLGMAGAWMTASGLWQHARAPEEPGADEPRVVQLRRMVVPAAMIASLVGFVALAPRVGYLPVSIVFTVGWTLFIAWRDPDSRHMRGIATAGTCSLILLLAIYWLFTRIIGVPL